MTFSPAVPASGIVGWRFLQRSYDSQLSAMKETPQFARLAAHFLEKIGQIASARELVADRQLLEVALGAFGLEGDIDNRFFVQKILEDGTSADDALANRLSDKRYRAFSDAFGFGPAAVRRTGLPLLMEKVVDRFQSQAFEVSVGEQNEDLRIALYADRELTEIASSTNSETTKWLSVLGLPPLRNMFETAFGLPPSFASVDLDKQIEIFQDRLKRLTGSAEIGQFTDPKSREEITNQFLARSQINALSTGISSASIALSLLQS